MALSAKNSSFDMETGSDILNNTKQKSFLNIVNVWSNVGEETTYSNMLNTTTLVDSHLNHTEDFFLNNTLNGFPHTTTTSQIFLLNETSTRHNVTFNTTLNDTTYWCQNESALPHDEDFYEFYETAQFITGLILYPCICIPGLMGNVLTLIVLCNRNMRTSTNAFLSALAVADSIKLLNDVLYVFTILLLRTDDIIGNRAYGYLYPYAHFIFSMSVCVSSWLTVSVAVERYIMVCHPTRARAVCSRGRAVTVCAAVFLIMTTLALPSALRYKTVECVRRDTLTVMLQVELTETWKNKQFVLAYNWTQNLLRSIIPLIVLVVLNTCIISSLRKTRANKKNSSRHRVTVMMIIVILAFLVCITPDAIMSTVFGLGYTEASNLVKGIREFTDTLLAINAATNFLIYCLFNRMFLDGCKSLFCRTKVTKKWHTELDESQYKRLNSSGHTKHHTNSQHQQHHLRQEEEEGQGQGEQQNSHNHHHHHHHNYDTHKTASNNNSSPVRL